MRRRSDDRHVARRMSEREMDALLRGPLAGFVADVEALAGPAPTPSAALAALLDEGLVPDPTLVPTLPRVPRRRAWLVPVPLAVLLAGTLGAASANALPAPAQRIVSDTVSSFTPIHLPKPAHGKPVGPPDVRPAVPGVRPTLPAPAVSHRAPQATAHPSPHPSPHASHRGRPAAPRHGRPTTTPTHGVSSSHENRSSRAEPAR